MLVALTGKQSDRAMKTAPTAFFGVNKENLSPDMRLPKQSKYLCFVKLPVCRKITALWKVPTLRPCVRVYCCSCRVCTVVNCLVCIVVVVLCVLL